MLKKIVMAFIAISFILSTAPLHNNEALALYGPILSRPVKTDWKYAYKSNAGVKKSAPKLGYTSGVANRTGESVSRSLGFDKTNSISASVSGNLFKTIQSEIGYSIGKTKTKGVSHNSGSLRKGEYVKFYENRSYQVTKVTLQRRNDSKTQCIIENKVVYTYKEQEPQITVKYCKKR
ncbi:hypothetical protein ACLNAR_26595 [Priestia aryabhattai]|uniref:hypothetical protein n=1 Tax=Priestia aryabhattai TaxID=412384 RepID=UPI00398F810A